MKQQQKTRSMRRTKLAAVAKKDNDEQRLRAAQTFEEARETEEENWRLVPSDLARRVRAAVAELESLRDAVEGVPFDITGDVPRSLENGAKRRWIGYLVESLNPRIRGLLDRCIRDASIEAVTHDIGDDLFNAEIEICETSFSVGLLAGVIFSGASAETVARYTRGFEHDMRVNDRVVSARH